MAIRRILVSGSSLDVIRRRWNAVTGTIANVRWIRRMVPIRFCPIVSLGTVIICLNRC